MSEVHSSKTTKPAKPFAEFPLFPHASGRWCKKIRGKQVYFGPWSDPDSALAKYLAEKDALHAGRKPAEVSAGVTIKFMCNQFLHAKKQLELSGELSARTWKDYEAACKLLAKHFGSSRLVEDVGPNDFAALRTKLAKKWGPVTLGNTIQRIRVIFKFAFDNGLTTKATNYGQGFKRPSKKTLRLEKAKHGPKLFARQEVRQILGCAPWQPAADGQLRAMILLAINCGFGNSDCGKLPLSTLDFEKPAVTYPRPKTGIPRRCPLWPETVEALRAVLVKRNAPKNATDAALVFLTKRGGSWSKDIADSPIAKEFRKLLDRLGIEGRRNFYTLRHTFRTVADAAKDQPAIDLIMGHESPHMASVYREHIADDRLEAVTELVRRWLFGA